MYLIDVELFFACELDVFLIRLPHNYAAELCCEELEAPTVQSMCFPGRPKYAPIPRKECYGIL